MCNWAVFTGAPTKDVLDKALKSLEGVSNKDATGVVLFTKNKSLTLKAPNPASEFVDSKAWGGMFGAAFKQEIIGGMLHARNATDGDATNPDNNHPHITEAGSILVHKGMVDVVTKLEAKGECDSEQIALSLDAHGLKDGILNLKGTACIAYYAHWEKEKQLYLYGDQPLPTWEEDKLRWVSTSMGLSPVKHEILSKDNWHILKFDGRIVRNTVDVKLPAKHPYNGYGAWDNEFYGKRWNDKNSCPHCTAKYQGALEWDMDMCFICFFDAYDKFKTYMGWKPE